MVFFLFVEFLLNLAILAIAITIYAIAILGKLVEVLPIFTSTFGTDGIVLIILVAGTAINKFRLHRSIFEVKDIVATPTLRLSNNHPNSPLLSECADRRQTKPCSATRRPDFSRSGTPCRCPSKTSC